MFISIFSPQEIKEMDREKALIYLGIISGNDILQPPRCPKCGESMIIAKVGDSDYLQCIECSNIGKMYSYQDTFFKGLK